MLLLLAVGIGVARIVGVKDEAYQAIAHVYVGGLGGAALVGGRSHATSGHWGWKSLESVLFWSLCIVEIACFAVSRLPFSVVVPLHQF